MFQDTVGYATSFGWKIGYVLIRKFACAKDTSSSHPSPHSVDSGDTEDAIVLVEYTVSIGILRILDIIDSDQASELDFLVLFVIWNGLDRSLLIYTEYLQGVPYSLSVFLAYDEILDMVIDCIKYIVFNSDYMLSHIISLHLFV
jgi:hypothetical protein